ncbi:early nodulin-like protein 20 [Ziziphus jujuba]|uniref:Early nodulin-like protein 20 n=2 Tax=Ziziphus jujuba TaxID=326968 RepID=A0A6P3Z8C7_ZIZJJ|nr:early nodulin-like protein 20 [Ziziphus jujuba]KAH7541924.1 hypothetical protein FEM48_Zijuj02G0019000 [Ziziphus jujuba var. spinosa]
MVGSRKRLVLKMVAVMVIMKLLCAECRDPVLHRVGGGRYGWNPETNFTEWSIHEHFYVGDWLYFGFDKKTHSVLEVNRSSYEKCIDKGFISNITRGGRDVFNLTEAKTYYFLDGRGFCIKGMKVSVLVEEYFPPIRPLSSPPDSPRPLFPNDGFPFHAVPRMTLIATALAFSLLL